MLDIPAGSRADDRLLTFEEAGRASSGTDIFALQDWVRTYLMQPHPDLGRTGAVCPFTRQSARIDAVRLAVSNAGPEDEEAAFTTVRAGFAELEGIHCKPGMEHFRTVIVGFPACGSPEGIAMLGRIQARHRFYSLSRFRMIGFMHAANEAPGLWNPAFRPLRAPMPVMAIRHMVEQDAPFAARHPFLMLAYLAKFRLAGLRRIVAARRQSVPQP